MTDDRSPVAASQSRPGLRLPPMRETADGAARRIGIELEFGDLTLAQATRIVQDRFGGTVKQRDAYRNEVIGTQWGDFLIELDAVLAHPEPGMGLAAEFGEMLAERIGDVASLWLPMEIACPPVPIERIDILETLVAALREAGATGTAPAPRTGGPRRTAARRGSSP